MKSDLVVEQVSSNDNWKSLVRHVNNTNLVKIMGNSDVFNVKVQFTIKVNNYHVNSSQTDLHIIVSFLSQFLI